MIDRVTRIAVVSGLSGAGRSVAAGAFEDLGWFVIDNLPGALVSKVGELALSGSGGYDRVALVMGGYDEEVSQEIELLRAQVQDVRAVFLEASTDVLVRRYVSTKRRHPHIDTDDDGEVGLVDAIELERKSLGPARAAADLVIDTSELNPHQLRERISSQFMDVGTDTSMRLTLTLFGFKHGLPLDADLVFDCRFLPNPHWRRSCGRSAARTPRSRNTWSTGPRPSASWPIWNRCWNTCCRSTTTRARATSPSPSAAPVAVTDRWPLPRALAVC